MSEEENIFHENAEEHGKKGTRLIMFSGTECTHCKEMYPLVDKLEKETNAKVTRLEVWHNTENAKLLEEYDNDGKGNKVCGGIPFFVNEKTNKKICGNTTLDKLKKWAQ